MLVDLSRVPERKHRRHCHASSSATEGFSGILEVYMVPKGRGALNTDKMCGVRVGNPHNSPPAGQWGGCEAEEGGETGVGWGECGVAIGVITHKQTAYASHQRTNTLPPLEHSYFQAAAFPYRKGDAGGWDEEPYLSPRPTVSSHISPCLTSCISFTSLYKWASTEAAMQQHTF